MKKILISVNQEPILADLGQEVQHILSASDLEACRTGRAIIIDQWGNEVGLEGALYSGEELTVKYL
jgi:S-adenosylmethionine synthetase